MLQRSPKSSSIQFHFCKSLIFEYSVHFQIKKNWKLKQINNILKISFTFSRIRLQLHHAVIENTSPRDHGYLFDFKNFPFSYYKIVFYKLFSYFFPFRTCMEDLAYIKFASISLNHPGLGPLSIIAYCLKNRARLYW